MKGHVQEKNGQNDFEYGGGDPEKGRKEREQVKGEGFGRSRD